MRELESNVYTLIHKPLDDDLTEKIEEAGGRWGRGGGWGWGGGKGKEKRKDLDAAKQVCDKTKKNKAKLDRVRRCKAHL